MDKFRSERIEDLKCEFYKVMGQLEIQKNIVISDYELLVFEKKLSECKSEVEAASFILGGIKRYSIQLQTDTGKIFNILAIRWAFHECYVPIKKNKRKIQLTQSRLHKPIN